MQTKKALEEIKHNLYKAREALLVVDICASFLSDTKAINFMQEYIKINETIKLVNSKLKEAENAN